MTSIFKKRFNWLAGRMQIGDEVAAAKIFEYFSELIFGYFLKRTLSKEISEDLTQEVFLKVIKNIDKYDPKKGDFYSWIWQIARNRIIDYWRIDKKEDLISLNDSLRDISNNAWQGRLIAMDIAREINNLKPNENRNISSFSCFRPKL